MGLGPLYLAPSAWEMAPYDKADIKLTSHPLSQAAISADPAPLDFS